MYFYTKFFLDSIKSQQPVFYHLANSHSKSGPVYFTFSKSTPLCEFLYMHANTYRKSGPWICHLHSSLSAELLIGIKWGH